VEAAPQHEASERAVDHGFGDIEVLFVISDEALPSGHPAEDSFDGPPSEQNLEAGGLIGAAHDEESEVAMAVRLGASIGEEVLEPEPMLTDGRDDGLGNRGRRKCLLL
jgi:hypothetical protein